MGIGVKFSYQKRQNVMLLVNVFLNGVMRLEQKAGIANDTPE